MIELTVKTLDSQNHQFAVEDGMTVAEFKIHIAEKVNIPAATQRIIYCGRVLQDNDKLLDYDVNGKVVHLVQRPPPSANQRNDQGNSSATENTNHNRGAGGGGGGGFMGFDRVGNAVFSLGSMAFGNDPSHIPRRATHNLSASRLNVARRMLRGAEHAINHLENPNDTSNNEQSPSPPAEPNTEEDMTPVIEAQIVDATNSDQPMDENAVINAVENSLFWDASSTMQVDAPPEGSSAENFENPQASEPSSTTPDPSQDSSSTTPSNTEQPGTSTQPNSNERNNANGTGGRRVLRTARGPEMAELLTNLNQLQARFAPFLARYQSFLQDDPQVAPENVESTGRMLRLVSHTMHYLSHAYHSLSDIIIDVEQPPPRLLVCRPILIQQSAMVHGGIPFQLEAQINIPAPADPSSNDTTSTTNASARGTATPPSTTTANAAQGHPQVLTLPAIIPNANINITQGPSTNMEFIGLPFVPVGGSMRVITTPIEIRTVRSNGSNPPRTATRTPNNNNNTAQARPSSAPPATDAATTDSQQSQNQPQQTQSPPQSQVPVAGPFGSNSNMEFVVEVTPEMFRGAMNGPPPEFIQSLMQLVNNQLFNRPAQQQQQQGGQQQRNGSTDATASQPSQNQAGVTGGSGQNSQARGNTQTNPTTATYTRSTARPHIQMTHQAVQGGFDPYLPCHSHHVVLHRHRVHQPTTATTNGPQEMGPTRQQRSNHTRGGSNPASQTTRETPTLQNLFGNLVNDTQGLDEIMAVSRAAENLVAMLANQGPGRQQQQQPTGDSNNQQQSANNQNNSARRRQSDPNSGARSPPASFLSTIFRGISDLNTRLSLDQLIPSFITAESDPPGTSLVTDLLMLLLRHLYLPDLFLLNSGDLSPLQRNREVIQQFFRTTVCQNYTSPQGIESATERVMTDMENIITVLGQVPARDNIDLERSVRSILRQHIPQLIKMAVNLESNDQMRPLLDRAFTAASRVLALVLHSALHGRQDVENVLVDMLTNSMTDIPSDIRIWSAYQTRMALGRAITNLNIPSSDIEQFIVYRSEEAEETRETPRESEQRTSDREMQTANNSQVLTNGVEEMVLDSSRNSLQSVRLMEDTEPLPNVVYGTEAWHRQTSEDWVPIITRDVYKQRRQNSQPPFSDAYLSGMPSKRRKLINSNKPQSSLPQVIKESLRQAVTSTGVASSTSVENVVAAAGASTEILTAYRNMLHTTVQENLKENEDFDSEQFPNASSYFSKSVD